MGFETTLPPTRRRAGETPVEHFFSQEGPFRKLIEAKKLLFSAVADSFYEPVEEQYIGKLSRSSARKGIKPLHNTLSLTESQDLLLQHVGLNGEFGHNFAMVEDSVSPNVPLKESRQKLSSLKLSLSAPSQLELAVSAGLAGITNAPKMQRVAGLTNGSETKAEAMKRCGRMIEKHLEANADTIPEGEIATIREHLTAYTAAVEQLLAFVKAPAHASRPSGPAASAQR